MTAEIDDLQNRLAKQNKANQAAAARADAAGERLRILHTEDAIADALTASPDLGSPTEAALQDIKRRALKATRLTDDGAGVITDSGDMAAYLRKLKDSAPHLFSAPAPGSIAGVPRTTFNKMKPAERLKLARQAGM